MDLSAPFESLFPTVDSAVLTVLAKSTKPRTGREIARLASRSQDATQRVLDRLTDQGLVLGREAGRARVYVLNEFHLAADPIFRLAYLRDTLIREVRERIESWHQEPLHVSLFGSTARGESDLHSDIDIFLVRPAPVEENDKQWREQVEGLADQVFEWTGNHAAIAEVGEGEVARLRKERPPIVGSLQADAIDLAGTPLRSLLEPD